METWLGERREERPNPSWCSGRGTSECDVRLVCQVSGKVPGQVPGSQGQQLHLLWWRPGGQLPTLSHLPGRGSLSTRDYRLFTSQGETVRRLQQDFFRLG